jgi:tetratricopeptide (TPR) repeat protein
VWFLGTRLFAADTNEAAANTNDTTAVTHAAAVERDEVAQNYSQIQEQLHATQTAIEQFQQIALATSQSNALALAQGLQSLEQTVSNQRIGEAEAAHKTQQLTLLIGGAFGLIGLGFLLLMVYYQWRAFTQLAQISSRQHLAVANGHAENGNGEAVHQLAAPGRAAVEASTTQLSNVVSRLEQRINELEHENGHRLLPEIPSVKPADLLAEGQKYLDTNLPFQALECFDKVLAGEPSRADALVKRAAALEKLSRDDEALASYNRAIAADNTLVIAHLHKGGLLNRLRRYDEALNCYEQALLGQDKKARA